MLRAVCVFPFNLLKHCGTRSFRHSGAGNALCSPHSANNKSWSLWLCSVLQDRTLGWNCVYSFCLWVPKAYCVNFRPVISWKYLYFLHCRIGLVCVCCWTQMEALGKLLIQELWISIPWGILLALKAAVTANNYTHSSGFMLTTKSHCVPSLVPVHATIPLPFP